MEVKAKVPVSGSAASAVPGLATLASASCPGAGGCCAAAACSGSPSSAPALHVQLLQSMETCPLLGESGGSTTASWAPRSAGLPRALEAEDWLGSEAGWAAGPRAGPRTRPRSLSRRSTASFSCSAIWEALWARSRVASNSTCALRRRALAAASRFASSPSSLAICRRPFCSSLSPPPLAFSSWSWSWRIGSCSMAFSSKKYFSRKEGSL
mmetsp:Transcript_25039/g.78901  ORF Transcript_25039/g.78901 Transcript_25039/m.78901 type:complete len:210 (+) Transcript_25039:651-1280(+)